MRYNRYLLSVCDINIRIFCLFVFSIFIINSMFADSKLNDTGKINNKPSVKKNSSGFDGTSISENDSFDYNKQNTREFEVKHLSHDQQFKTDLDTDRYEILIKAWLNYKYKNRFNDDSWASKYFIKALAQMTYSMNGTLTAENFNNVLEGRKTFFIADSYIKALNVKPEIKYALSKLYAAACIYTRKVKSLKYSLNKMKKIPPDSILYEIPKLAEFDSGKNKNENKSGKTLKQALKKIRAEDTLGDYVGTAHGENLYFICASYYDNFMNLPLDQQVQFLNTVYSYNPTLMRAPDIKRNYYLYGYLKQLIFPEKAPEALKYCLRGQVNWLLLPPSIKQKVNTKVQ
ncbi:MAG TPA: hypothetical protein QF753_17605 [Victivallales bacterium]|nr:hypothetical protein [Victivallales bacterium]